MTYVGALIVTVTAGLGLLFLLDDQAEDKKRFTDADVEAFVKKVDESATDCTAESEDGVGKWVCVEPNESTARLTLTVGRDGSVDTVNDATTTGSFVVGCCVPVND
jgi:hypothetical protein